jgi:hypothetical protein
MCMDKAKLRQAITTQDKPVVERQATAEDNKIDMPKIADDSIGEIKRIKTNLDLRGVDQT